jgi:tryptophanyl-tRNA synthetase
LRHKNNAMARILTGIQSSGRQHLGNILGGIQPGIELSAKSENDSFLFIADLHSLTTIKSAEERKQNVLATASAWLACGLDTDKTVFYRQSDIPEVSELTWILSCFTPYPMLANAHSFKDKAGNLKDVNAGLFVYPVLMACDIILYNANIVPVGKDQQQHIEMTRDIANTFNHIYGETFVIPEASINKTVQTVPGVDGRKMSKSYNNFIDVFLPEKELKKQVYSIVTDSTPLEDPKGPDKNLIFNIFSLIASEPQIETMRGKFLAGNYGYGHAKKELLDLIIEKYKTERDRFNYFMENPAEVESHLKKGAYKARIVAKEVLEKVKEKTGFNS